MTAGAGALGLSGRELHDDRRGWVGSSEAAPRSASVRLLVDAGYLST
jgi:hypothetical protein